MASKTRADLLAGIEPGVRALCPLTAQEVSAVYRLDYHKVLDEIRLFQSSGGRRGLRASKLGGGWRVRPAAVEEWLIGLENQVAQGRA